MSSEHKILIKAMPQLPYAVEEAINRLRANVNFLGKDIHKIMVISSDPNEGKSFITMQLWRQMAESGASSLLLDADLRRSALIRDYDMQAEDSKNIQGTSHFLANAISPEEAIYHTEYANGDILPNADNVINPSLLLENSRMKELLHYAEERYRYIFVDCAPLSVVSDGEILGNLCDGAILCVRSGMTPKSFIRNSMNQLQRSGCPLLGIVLNRVEDQNGGYYHKYYGRRYYNSKYYRAYYGSKEKDKK